MAPFLYPRPPPGAGCYLRGPCPPSDTLEGGARKRSEAGGMERVARKASGGDSLRPEGDGVRRRLAAEIDFPEGEGGDEFGGAEAVVFAGGEEVLPELQEVTGNQHLVYGPHGLPVFKQLT